MHYDWQAIMDAAVEVDNGYKKTVLTLEDGDTAHSAISTKWDFDGPGRIQYLIHPSGWTVTPSDTISRHYT